MRKSKAPDPLAAMSARGRIDRAQYLAGREFQKQFVAADKRRPTNGECEQADAAWKWMAKCYRALGADGSALVNDVLIHLTAPKQIAEARGKTGPDWERYYAKRVRECLGTMAEVFGFSKAETKTPHSAQCVGGGGVGYAHK